jgi:RimJ/RimL family protein N-acetyltransferase
VTAWLPLQTERLLLREYRAEDEDAIYLYASDPEVARFADWGPSDTSTIRANLQRRLKDQEIWPRSCVEPAVELVNEKCLIGGMRITIVDQANRTADFGYLFNRFYWNHGYATEAAQALLGVAFSDLNLHRVWATCDVRNRASWRVMEKLGMRREAHFKKDIFQKGEWRDSYLYAILADEWHAASSA